MFLVMRWLVFE
jgi:hypothetical protein